MDALSFPPVLSGPVAEIGVGAIVDDLVNSRAEPPAQLVTARRGVLQDVVEQGRDRLPFVAAFLDDDRAGRQEMSHVGGGGVVAPLPGMSPNGPSQCGLEVR